MIKRTPVATGSFYAAKPNILANQIEQAFMSDFGPASLPRVNPNKKGNIKALIAPHAGYIYSGPIAACAYYSLAEDHTPEKVLLIGPNHSGYGQEISLYPEGVWLTPLGEIEVDNSWITTDNLKTVATEDELAHRFEHSLEVQLPFLQYLFKNNFTISAITIRNQSLDNIKKIAEAILENGFPLIISTTDLSHYEPSNIAKAKDSFFINAVKAKDADSVYKEIDLRDISACGPGPASIAAIIAKALNWKIETLCYNTSGAVSGDNSSVVGYMSAIAKTV